MKRELKVGDHVRVSRSYDDFIPVGKSLRNRIGVIRISNKGCDYGVSFSRWHHGHDLDSRALPLGSRNGWYIPTQYLTLIDVKRKGKTYRVVRKGKRKAA